MFLSGADAAHWLGLWLRFGLVLNYCCGEPNSVVFSSEQWSIEFGEQGDLRLDGPRCDGPVDCTETERRVQLVPNGATVIEFDVFRATTDAAPPLSEGTLTVDTAPLFDWSTDALTDEPMSVTFRLDVSRTVPPPSGDTTPTLTPLDPVTVVGGGLYLVDFPLIPAPEGLPPAAARHSPSSISSRASVASTLPCPGSGEIITTPPVDGMTPAWSAARQTPESDV